MEPYHISDQWCMCRLVINSEPWYQTSAYIHTTQWLHSSFHNLTDENETSWTVQVGNKMCLPFCFPLASFIHTILLTCWGSLYTPPFVLWKVTNSIMHRTLEWVHMHKCCADCLPRLPPFHWAMRTGFSCSFSTCNPWWLIGCQNVE